MQARLDKKLAEGFAEFYDEIRDTEYILQGLLQKGKTLTDEDINIFWATFKTAQKEAYIAGAIALREKSERQREEVRSMISPDYARNFICDFILGKQQDCIQQKEFDFFS